LKINILSRICVARRDRHRDWPNPDPVIHLFLDTVFLQCCIPFDDKIRVNITTIIHITYHLPFFHYSEGEKNLAVKISRIGVTCCQEKPGFFT